MISVEDALERILAAAPKLHSERIDISKAAGRVLAADVRAERDQPPADSSAMDGYAVRYADVANLPAKLNVIGEAPAGTLFTGQVGAGEAVRIFTGGVMPTGTDTVIMQENTAENGNDHGVVTVLEGARLGRHVRQQGHDFSAGDILVEKGTRLGPRQIGLIAAGNIAALEVTVKPRVTLLSTGDELVPPGTADTADQIVNSNAPMLAALLQQAGADVTLAGVARDEPDALKSALAQIKDTDLLITIGGASVGARDLVQVVLKDLGFQLDFWKVRMRPGKPVIFGRFGETPVLGLPGNPVSAMVGTYLFVLPMIQAMLGSDISLLTQTAAKLTDDLAENGDRQAYLRARIELSRQGQWTASIAHDQDSAALRSLSKADGLIVRYPDAPALPAGTCVPVILFSSPGLV